MVDAVDHDSCLVPVSRTDWHFRYFLVALVFFSNISLAGQLEAISITESGGQYEARIVALFDAPAEYVYGVITDYKHIYRINPSIVESELLSPQEDGVIRVRNRIEHCIAIFCIEVEMVEDVVEVGDGHIVATTVPELSSFESGTVMWHIRPFGEGRARVQYRASMKPGFFIPPVIGSLIIKSRLREEITISFSRIECHATIMAKKDIEDKTVSVARRSGENTGCAG